MKVSLLLVLSCVLFLYTQAQTVDQAIAHNDGIVADQLKMIEAEDAFVSTIVNNKDQKDIEKAFEIYSKTLKKLSKKYNKMKAFDSKDTFRKAMIEMIAVFKSVADNEYREIMSIYSMDVLLLTDIIFDRWEALAQLVNDKETAANEQFMNAQKTFAGEYQFTLNNSDNARRKNFTTLF